MEVNNSNQWFKISDLVLNNVFNPLMPELNPPPPATLVAIRLFKGLTAQHIQGVPGGMCKTSGEYSSC